MFEAKLNYIFFCWLQITWISELTGHTEWLHLKTLTEFTQLETKFDPILNYSSIYIEWKKRLIQGCVKSEQVFTQIEAIVDCKHSRPSVNEHYSYVQRIILYHRWVTVENLFRKKETVSRLCHSRVLFLLKNRTTFIAKL